MTKTSPEDWLTPENRTLLEGWARDGLTDDQIAGSMGISRTTLYRWKTKHEELAEALRRGKEVVDYQVENALLKAALGGNTTAQQFWLRNRRPDKWRDKPDPSPAEGSAGGVVVLAPVMENPGPPAGGGNDG